MIRIRECLAGPNSTFFKPQRAASTRRKLLTEYPLPERPVGVLHSYGTVIVQMSEE